MRNNPIANIIDSLFALILTLLVAYWMYENVEYANPSQETCSNLPSHFTYIGSSNFEHHYLSPNKCFVRLLDHDNQSFRTVRKATDEEIKSTVDFLKFK